MLTTCYITNFPSELSKAKSEIAGVIRFLKIELPRITDDNIFEIRIIYSELISNAIIHGNKNNISKKVHLIAEIYDDLLISVIKDEGQGFDYVRYYVNANLGGAAKDIFSEHGRGLRLVNYLTHSLCFNGIGNEATFTKSVSG